MTDDLALTVEQLQAELRLAQEREAAARADADAMREALAASEARETAMAEILGVIASSPNDSQPVLDAIVERAMHLSKSTTAALGLRDGEHLRVVASGGVQADAHRGTVGALNQRRSSVRALVEQRTIHIADHSDPAVLEEFPENQNRAAVAGVNVPLIRQHEAIGVLQVLRDVAESYSARDIALVEAFADQAVIAIENARLFQELEQRNRQLHDALDQQTATAEVLKAISRSAFDLQPILETLIENAVRLCSASHGGLSRFDGEQFLLAAAFGSSPELLSFQQRTAIRPGRDSAVGRAALERRTVHIPDVLLDPDYGYGARQLGIRTILAVPMSARVPRSAPCSSGRTKSSPSALSRSRCWKRSRTRP